MPRSSSFALIPLLLIGCAAMTGCDRKKPAEPQAQPAAAPKVETAKVILDSKGDEAPAIPFASPDDTPATLGTFRGQPLLVNMWATWCAPCVAEMPTLDTLAQQRAGSMKVIAISQDMEGRRVVTPFFAKKKFASLQPYLDKENGLMLALKADELPMTILYDAKGKELWRVRGSLDWTGPRAKALIDDAIAGKDVAAG